MKKILQNMSPKERSDFRRWQAWWISFYAVVIVALVCIANLLPAPRDTEVAQASSTPRSGP